MKSEEVTIRIREYDYFSVGKEAREILRHFSVNIEHGGIYVFVLPCYRWAEIQELEKIGVR